MLSFPAGTQKENEVAMIRAPGNSPNDIVTLGFENDVTGVVGFSFR